MDQLKDVPFTNTDQVIELLKDEGIDDMETLRTAHEDDLRKAGLKMGDIIKIRKLLASDVASQNTGDIFNSSLSSTESENEASKPIQQTLVKQDVKGQEFASSTKEGYSAKDMLQKSPVRTKRTKAQLYFRNLIRDCAREARIWQRAYTLPSIPDGRLHKFFELITTAAPQLAGHKADVRMSLSQALQNRRKYENDVKIGKRSTKSRKQKEVVTKEKSIVSHLQQKAPTGNQTSGLHIRNVLVEKNGISIVPDAPVLDDDNKLPFHHGEEVIVYKTTAKTCKLAKATYLGPKDISDKNDMYSLLQLKTKFSSLTDQDDIPLPAETIEGDTTLNQLMTNKHLEKTKKDDEPMVSVEKEKEEAQNGLPSSPIKGHDGKTLCMDQWVAVAYDDDFYVGKITLLSSKDEINVNFISKVKFGTYKWPKRKTLTA
ncbi:hypothetical protein OS493_020847 [Desmophyllum pertusum]|uniref:Uncharacterized protein n=1 Tax=Desmophyllum pertusum TaxID=174260 RepID=A0A9W9YB62_9CNID|nr:hypothetical protein OS493_020847 [Desmophyllum pertusum]